MAKKTHWTDRTEPLAHKMPFALACGLDAWLGSALTGGPRWLNASASVYLDLAKPNPDWFCAHCVKAARLALAAESAPKPDEMIWPKPRPISEAPTDGSMVLIRLPDCNPQWTIGVFDPRRRWVDLCLATAIVEPTHFLPLPPEVK